MIVQADFSVLRQTRWREYAVRFIFGGAITALTGLVPLKWGPGAAGLFLAFPAIFHAAVWLSRFSTVSAIRLVAFGDHAVLHLSPRAPADLLNVRQEGPVLSRFRFSAYESSRFRLATMFQ